MNNLLEIGYFKKCAKNGHSDTLAPLQQLVWYYYQTYVRSFCKKTHLSLRIQQTEIGTRLHYYSNKHEFHESTKAQYITNFFFTDKKESY